MDAVEERDEDGYNLDDIQSKIERLEQVLTQNIQPSGAGSHARDRRHTGDSEPATHEFYNASSFVPATGGETHQGVRGGTPSQHSQKPRPQTSTPSQTSVPHAKKKSALKAGTSQKMLSPSGASEEHLKDSARGHKQLSPKYAPMSVPAPAVVHSPPVDEYADEMADTVPLDMEHALNQGTHHLDPRTREGRDSELESKKLQEEEKLL